MARASLGRVIHIGSLLADGESAMITPTQAQIEAAAKAIAYELNLTHSDIAPHIDRAAKAALTAAAEVMPSPINIYNTVYQEAIERCARVAENHHLSIIGKAIAAEIRALKDELERYSL